MLTVVLIALISCTAATASRRHISPARQSAVDLLNGGIIEGSRILHCRSPMEGTGRELEAAGHKWHVSPFLIAAIAATESSLGCHACQTNQFNAFGLASCSQSWRVPIFLNYAAAYDFMGRYLTGHTRITSGWPHARTPWDLHRYAACDRCWGDKVVYWMRRLFSSTPETRYA